MEKANGEEASPKEQKEKAQERQVSVRQNIRQRKHKHRRADG